LVFGDIEDNAKPLAVLVHGFPDTPYTWRHLGPQILAAKILAWLSG
jgi:hypothetical protein